ncbi:ORF MSV128 hypothetical protein [Melanoplus sanguinipes entomopoxvirus]|uniref:Uncharacterized protein n=1 Tax=Melanoplus sanguinipes entomopoxvirus TaxID=83191 RepID=Q9YVW4_MSEPV|nr:ORF MSV128 hypothetical protein [Melanoplus sanguinipes entomopoxvirus]AAC97795.1 ORF MSV128 hypothetical protein [Melanoplus sanguinipes entomopoxvirus 'O']
MLHLIKMASGYYNLRKIHVYKRFDENDSYVKYLYKNYFILYNKNKKLFNLSKLLSEYKIDINKFLPDVYYIKIHPFKKSGIYVDIKYLDDIIKYINNYLQNYGWIYISSNETMIKQKLYCINMINDITKHKKKSEDEVMIATFKIENEIVKKFEKIQKKLISFKYDDCYYKCNLNGLIKYIIDTIYLKSPSNVKNYKICLENENPIQIIKKNQKRVNKKKQIQIIKKNQKRVNKKKQMQINEKLNLFCYESIQTLHYETKHVIYEKPQIDNFDAIIQSVNKLKNNEKRKLQRKCKYLKKTPKKCPEPCNNENTDSIEPHFIVSLINSMPIDEVINIANSIIIDDDVPVHNDDFMNIDVPEQNYDFMDIKSFSKEPDDDESTISIDDDIEIDSMSLFNFDFREEEISEDVSNTIFQEIHKIID